MEGEGEGPGEGGGGGGVEGEGEEEEEEEEEGVVLHVYAHILVLHKWFTHIYTCMYTYAHTPTHTHTHTYLCDRHTEQPLSLVVQLSVLLTLLQLFHHPPHFVGRLCSLTQVSPT